MQNTKNYTEYKINGKAYYVLYGLEQYCETTHQVVLGKRDIMATWNVPNTDSQVAEFHQEELDDLDKFIQDNIHEMLSNYEKKNQSKIKGWIVKANRYVTHDDKLLIYNSQFLTLNKKLEDILLKINLPEKIKAYHDGTFVSERAELFVNHDKHFILGKNDALILYLKEVLFVDDTLLFSFIPVTEKVLQDKQNHQIYHELLHDKYFDNNQKINSFLQKLDTKAIG